MISQFLEQQLKLPKNSLNHRRAYVNFTSAILVLLCSMFFAYYDYAIKYNWDLLIANISAFSATLVCQFLLLYKRQLLSSSIVLTCVVVALTHYYIYETGNKEYALVFGIIAPLISITLLPKRLALLFMVIQFVTYIYWLLSHLNIWRSAAFTASSCINLISVWLVLTVTITYLELSRDKAYRQLHKTNQRLQHIAITDTLTQVYNRRYIEQKIDASPSSYHLAMIDVDDFKHVNDTHGHISGDNVLKGIADLLHDEFHPHGIVGRWGGEEFIVLLPVTYSYQQAFKLTEQARKRIESADFDIKETVSVSIGLSASSHDNYETILRRADQALYKAKAQGKNQTVTENAGRESH
ncbi:MULTISPECIES: GGDEF domain-containing protein [Vibrio]|uniref:diguanylate cyclase n=2 Tax=Vibrio TaxID=662 RepID=A0A7X4LLI4_9VIBR|nr:MULTISPECIES: GGDEF domain-containing protein [Vibrio]MBF9002064.1 GGDEF domain-containing protein [Vibrio nitrifigilis]MZI93995.1 diguanylate cyclase [Vibrio eleionomae]